RVAVESADNEFSRGDINRWRAENPPRSLPIGLLSCSDHISRRRSDGTFKLRTFFFNGDSPTKSPRILLTSSLAHLTHLHRACVPEPPTAIFGTSFELRSNAS